MILFGSGARGEDDAGSDLDFLVIERSVDDRIAEAVHLRRALGDIGVPVDIIVLDDVVGFHAQQAVEKAVKAVLVLHGVDFPRSHDLDFLLARADGHGLRIPDLIEDAEWLTPMGRPVAL